MKKNKIKKIKFVVSITALILLIVIGSLLTGFAFLGQTNNFSNSSIWMIIFGIIFLFLSVFVGSYVTSLKEK